MNAPIQGTAADVTKKALGMLPGKLVGTGAKLIGTVHDEILLEVPADQAEAVANILKTTMIAAGATFLQRVPVEVDWAITASWAKK